MAMREFLVAILAQRANAQQLALEHLKIANACNGWWYELARMKQSISSSFAGL
jgi:hypothetical protein